MDWNVVASVQEKSFVRGCEILEEFGHVKKTNYYNVLVLKVEDIHKFLEGLLELIRDDPYILTFFGKVIPVEHTFHFQNREEFEKKASESVLLLVDELAGKSFHVRVHRRGFKGKISGHEEEVYLDQILLQVLEEKGKQGKIIFDDHDAIISVETVGDRAGVSIWTREQLKKYPFLRLD